MTTSAHHTLGALQLPRSLIWVDEFDWNARVRAVERSITGAQIIDRSTRIAGRPITLQGVADHGWVRRSTLQSLWALVDSATEPLELTLADGREFHVIFAPDNPIEAEAIARAELPPADLPYVVTLRLLTHATP